MASGGQTAMRGFLVQTLIALLDAVDDSPGWISVTLEPNVDSEKVDILWERRDGTKKAVQVKSTQRTFGKADVEKWARELQEWKEADEYELVLVGQPASEAVAGISLVGKVVVPEAMNLNVKAFHAFQEQAATRVQLFMQSQRLPEPKAKDALNLVDLLIGKLAMLAVPGKPLPRDELVELLKGWVPADGGPAKLAAYRDVGRLGDRKALRRYLDQTIEEHKYFTFLGRAKPLDLDKIYIALKVGEYVPPKEKPDDPRANSLQDRPPSRYGAVLAPEALLLDPPRLLVLGEPGSGKTTLLRHVALRIASRDPAFGDFAREHVANTWARLADRIHTHLANVDLCDPGFCLATAGSCALMITDIFSLRPGIGLLCGFTLGMTSGMLWLRRFVAASSLLSVALLVLVGITPWSVGAMALPLLLLLSPYWIRVAVSSLLSVALLVFVGIALRMPPWSVGAMALPLLLLLSPYWARPFLRALRWLRDRWTNYPLPLYLTLNDKTGSVEPLESRLARPLEDAGFTDARTFLRRRLEAGECLLLMDGLDEVVDGAARDRMAEWLGHNRIRARNSMVVTCRIAAFEAHPLDHRFSGFHRMEVQELVDRQVGLFLRRWFADRSPEEQQQRVAGLFAALGRNARIRLLAANPLLLSLIALVFERDWTLPDKRFDLYEKCVDVLLEEWDKAKGLESQTRFDRATKQVVLQSLAVRFHEAGIRQFTEDELRSALSAAVAGLSAADREVLVQEIMVRSNLIRRKSRTSFDFAHLTFQEYFTARDFAERGDVEGLLGHLGDPWWREVVLLFAGLQRDATDLLVRLRRHDLVIAAAALADARTVPTVKFTQIADGIVAELKSWMETDCGRRQEAADALAEIPRNGVREYLAEQSRDQGSPEVALAAVLALGRCADRSALDSLWPHPGLVLRLLHGSLRDSRNYSTHRILTVLERFGFEWVFVPAGEFVTGKGRSQQRVYLGDYWMSKYPVTNAQFARFVHETDYQTSMAWRYAFTKGHEQHPVVHVSWNDASAFCRWAGVALPSQDQWEKAARGTDGRTYPWGNAWDAGRCNSSGPPGTTPVDQHPNGVSPYGCFDMVGNVWEWCTDLIINEYRVIRGGRFPIDAEYLRSTCYSRFQPHRRHGFLGFRVVAVSPSSGQTQETSAGDPFA